jgi:hypothetical protein
MFLVPRGNYVFYFNSEKGGATLGTRTRPESGRVGGVKCRCDPPVALGGGGLLLGRPRLGVALVSEDPSRAFANIFSCAAWTPIRRPARGARDLRLHLRESETPRRSAASISGRAAEESFAQAVRSSAS